MRMGLEDEAIATTPNGVIVRHRGLPDVKPYSTPSRTRERFRKAIDLLNWDSQALQFQPSHF